MLPIVSGTTVERTVRTGLLTVLITGFAIAYLWDGYVGYGRDNTRELVRSLGMNVDPLPIFDSRLTEDEAGRRIEDIEIGAPSETVRRLFGLPHIEHAGDAYYLGPGGHVRVQMEHGRITEVGWHDGLHTETDQKFQRYIGAVLGVLGLLLIIKLLRVVTTRVSVTDKGLKMRGHPLIPFEAIRALRATKSGKTGQIELEYSLDGRTRRAHLDDYVIKEFGAVVSELCERAGFPNPHASASAASDAVPPDVD
jgi:hypothetical protein